MRARSHVLASALLLTLAACASKTVVVPVVSSPTFPDFVEPVMPADLAGTPAAVNQQRAWQFLQAGDLRNADREVSAALKRLPAFYPAQATAGYVALARRDMRAAVVLFDRALARQAGYVPALAGRGQALMALGRDKEAIEAFEAALAADPTLTELARRIEVVRFRDVQRDVASARQAARSGKVEEAVRAYQRLIELSPESAFLYREIAVLERDRGDVDAALEHYRKATALDPGDPAPLAEMAALLDARDEFDAALAAYDAALALAPDPELARKRDALRGRAEVAKLPEEYRAIPSAAQITRADLAALIGFRLAALLDATRPRSVGVMTDIRGHWADRWILAVTRAGVMDAYANHTFQPQTPMRRVDFAQVVMRLLTKVAALAPEQAGKWRNARGRFSDVGPGHVAYPAASSATASGVMTIGPDQAFDPSRPVSGAEAIEALDRLAALARLTPRSGVTP